MKILSSLFLFLLLSSLAYPTVSVLVKKLGDKTETLALAEEENENNSKEVKDFKFDCIFSYSVSLPFCIRIAPSYSSTNAAKLKSIAVEILIPPPKFI